MAKFKVKPKFRSIFSEKLMDLGNLAIAALVLGQFVSGREISVQQFFVGLMIMVVCYTISLLVSP